LLGPVDLAGFDELPITLRSMLHCALDFVTYAEDAFREKGW